MEQSCTCDVPMDSGGPPAVDAGAMFRPEEGCDGGRDTAVNEPRPAAPPGGAAGMAPEMQAVAGPYDGAPQYMPGGQVAPAPQYGYAGFPPAPQYGYAG
ncbi:MAG: hypothetical protein JW781_01025, partial [Deltaproteobacteria bacterium]|nr:hypothetical protein [Candidatus Anaeroferrophillacea bacterium]